jgi:hypothetical protein
MSSCLNLLRLIVTVLSLGEQAAKRSSDEGG